MSKVVIYLSYSHFKASSQKYQAKILDNLEVTIKNVHIRYEDLDSDACYSWGVICYSCLLLLILQITIDEIFAVTTND